MPRREVVDLSHRGDIERAFVGALRATIHAHGPITAETAPSAAKRMVGEIKALNREIRHGEYNLLVGALVRKSAATTADERELWDALVPDAFSPLGWAWECDFEDRGKAVAFLFERLQQEADRDTGTA